MALEQDLLSIGFDWKKTQADADKVLASLKNVLETSEKLDNKKISLSNITGTGELKKVLADIQKTYADINTSVNNCNKTIAENTKQQIQNAKAAAENEKVKQQSLKTDQQKQKLEQESIKTTKLKTTESEKAARAAKVEEKAIADLSSDYKQLSIAYTEAALKAKNLALQQGLNAPAAKAAAAEANALGNKLKEVDAATGSFTRNVGDYAGGLGKFVGKAFGLIKTAANILPGLGISGLLLVIYDGIVSLTGASKASEEQLKKEKDARESVASGMASEVARIAELKAVAESEVASRGQRKKAIEELIELQPKYFNGLKEENGVVTGLQVAYDNYTNSILKTAQAKAAGSALEELYKKRLDLQLQATQDLGKVQKTVDDYNASVEKAFKRGGVLPVQNFDQETQKNINVAASIQGIDREIKTLIKTITANPIAIDDILDGKGNKKEKTEKKIKTIAETIAELRNELKAIQFEQNEGIINLNEADLKRVDKYKATIAEIYKLKASDKDKDDASLKLRFELLPIDDRIAQQQVKDLMNRLNKDDENRKPPLEIKAVLNKEGFEENEAKFYDEIAQRQLTAIATESIKEQQALNERFAKGKISREDYERELFNIQTFYAEKSFAENIKWLQREVEALEPGTKAREDAEKKVADATLQAQNLVTSKLLENQKALAAGYKELGQSILSVFEEIILSGYDREKAAIDDIQTKKDANYQREIENIQKSTLNKQQQADEIAVIQAQQDAQSKISEDKKTELDRKKARTEKLIKAAEITGTAVQTVFKLGADAVAAKAQATLLLANPLTAGLAPLAFASAAAIAGLIPVTLGIAAAQIAKLVIPKFALGVIDKKDDGLGLFGEAGAERVEIPGQKPFIADKPTIGWLPKHTNIIPLDKEMNKKTFALSAANVLHQSDPKQDLSLGILSHIESGINKLVKKRTTVNVKVYNDTEWERWKREYFNN